MYAYAYTVHVSENWDWIVNVQDRPSCESYLMYFIVTHFEENHEIKYQQSHQYHPWTIPLAPHPAWRISRFCSPKSVRCFSTLIFPNELFILIISPSMQGHKRIMLFIQYQIPTLRYFGIFVCSCVRASKTQRFISITLRENYLN